MRLMKCLTLSVVVASIAGFVFLSVQSSTAAEAKPINIGVTEDFSGVSAPEGTSEFPAFEMAVKEITPPAGLTDAP